MEMHLCMQQKRLIPSFASHFSSFAHYLRSRRPTLSSHQSLCWTCDDHVRIQCQTTKRWRRHDRHWLQEQHHWQIPQWVTRLLDPPTLRLSVLRWRDERGFSQYTLRWFSNYWLAQRSDARPFSTSPPPSEDSSLVSKQASHVPRCLVRMAMCATGWLERWSDRRGHRHRNKLDIAFKKWHLPQCFLAQSRAMLYVLFSPRTTDRLAWKSRRTFRTILDTSSQHTLMIHLIRGTYWLCYLICESQDSILCRLGRWN